MAIREKVKVAFAAFTVLSVVFGAYASSIVIDSVAQRWPFNNKLDITYTVEDGQDAANGLYCRIMFTAEIGNESYEIDGRKIGANASDGQHTATWTLPSGLKASGCTMTATLLAAENPSGDDYMIVDLQTGEVTYEGLLGTGADGQTRSNARYNNDVYKTTKMVLRKVPRWADRASLPNGASLPENGYPTGYKGTTDTDGINSKYPNSPTGWKTARYFYIAIFPMTAEQYAQAIDYNEGSNSMVPRVNVKYAGVRGSYGVNEDVTEFKSNGTAFERLNLKTKNSSNMTGFDFPTEVMYEIAARGGNTTKFYWGEYYNGYIDKYAVNLKDALANVGSLAANSWGLYDVAGNVWEICRDKVESAGGADMAQNKDAFTANETGDSYAVRGGGMYENGRNKTPETFMASYRNQGGTANNGGIGFRVAYIVK